MKYIKKEASKDEIKGRECADYVMEFCPERLLSSGQNGLSEGGELEKDDSSLLAP